MNKKQVLSVLLIAVVIITGARFKEPSWVKYQSGVSQFKTKVGGIELEEMTTGVYTTALSNQIDYKQPQEIFEKQAEQYKSDGSLEMFYESNQTIPVAYMDTSDYQSQYPADTSTGIAAYDSYKPSNNLSFDIANGQWLVDNDIFSRFNQKVEVQGSSVVATSVQKAPWGVKNSVTPASRDEFVVGLAKAVYGVIESRPVYLEVPAYRYAKAIYWDERYVLDPDTGEWIFQETTYREEEGGNSGRPGKDFANGSAQSINGYVLQRVSGYNDSRNKAPSNYMWQTISGSTRHDYYFRGEFVTHPEGFENSITHMYKPDKWSHVSTNVWELYLLKMLSMGILDYDEAFRVETDAFDNDAKADLNIGPAGDTFNFAGSLSDANSVAYGLNQEYLQYGNVKDKSNQNINFPAYAPELGIAVGGNPQSIRDVNMKLLSSSAINVLGRNYKVNANRVLWDSDWDVQSGQMGVRAEVGLPNTQYFKYQQMTNIAALRLIERIMRVEEKNMSALEAKIITQKYGAKYLDNIPERDRKTVEYLIAQGIVDFENYQEYSNLYSILNREFCYTLLYRVANPAARTDFSKLLLTDASTMALDLPSGYNNYQNSVMSNSPGGLDKFINKEGIMVYDSSSSVPRELSLMSSVYVDSVWQSVDNNPIFHVKLSMDDPMKYLYRNMPLVMTQYSYGNYAVGEGSMYKEEVGYFDGKQLPDKDKKTYYKVYLDNMFGARDIRLQQRIAKFAKTLQTNGINKSSEKPAVDYRDYDKHLWFDAFDDKNNISISNIPDVTGIIYIWQYNGSGRYFADISIAAVDAESAKTFVLANLTPLTQGLLNETPVASAVSTTTNTLVVDSSNKTLTGGAVINNDIISSSSGNAIINEKAGIVGTTVVSGDTRVEVGGTQMISSSIAQRLTANVATETVGSKPIITALSPILNKTNAVVYSMLDKSLAPIQTRFFATPNLNYLMKTNALNQQNPVSSLLYMESNSFAIQRLSFTSNDASRYVNLTTANLGDVFTKEEEYSYTQRTPVVKSNAKDVYLKDGNYYRDVKEKVNVTIVVQLIPDLPSAREQHQLVGTSVTPSANISDLYNWIYTKPDNEELRLHWDYNIGITNAVMKTLGITAEPVKTGFVYPRISLLVDKVPDDKGLVTITEEQLLQIENEFLTKVGSNIDSSWVDAYVGNANLYNQTIKTMPEAEKVRAEKGEVFRRVQDGGNWFFETIAKTSKSIPNARMVGKLPLWSELYFFYVPTSNAVQTHFYHTRLSTPSIEILPIASFDGPNRLYGHVLIGAYGDAGITNIPDSAYDVYVPFAKTDNNNLYVDISKTGYVFNEQSNALVVTGQKTAYNNSKGKKISYGDFNFIVVGEDDLDLMLVLENPIMGHGENGQLLDAKTKKPIDKVAEAYMTGVFKRDQMDGVNETYTYNFSPFDTSVASVKEFKGKKLAEILDGKLVVNNIEEKNGVIVKTPIPVKNGDVVYYRPYIRLSKATWNLNSDGTQLLWSKRFLGCDYKFYQPKNNITLLQADILPINSENRVAFSEIENATLTIGSLKGYKDSDGVTTVLLPFTEDMLNSAGASKMDVLKDSLTTLSTPVVTHSGDTFNATDYSSNHALATYSKNFPSYDNTLITVGDKLYVATGDKMSPYTAGMTIKTVALTMDIDPKASMIVVKDENGAYKSVTFDSRQAYAPSVPVPKRENKLLDSGLTMQNLGLSTGVYYQGADDAKVYALGLLNYIHRMRVSGWVGMLVWFVLIMCVVASVSLVLARLLRRIPFVYTWFSDFWDSSGIDVYRIMSITLINVEEEPLDWGRVLLYSLLLVLVPTLIVALMKGFGINFW